MNIILANLFTVVALGTVGYVLYRLFNEEVHTKTDARWFAIIAAVVVAVIVTGAS